MIVYNQELAHHGILGMKWGVRRFQNPDGSLTDAGKKRYSSQIQKSGNPTEFVKETVNDSVIPNVKALKEAGHEYGKLCSEYWNRADAVDFWESEDYLEATNKAYDI